MDRMPSISPIRFKTCWALDYMAAGYSMAIAAELTDMDEGHIQGCLTKVSKRLGLDRFTLLENWKCELFQIGLREMGYR